MQDAFFLLLRNCARLAVLTGVVSFLMFLSKIVVVGLCAALSYIVFSGTLQVIHYIVMKKYFYYVNLDFHVSSVDKCWLFKKTFPFMLYVSTGCTSKCVGC